MVLWLIRNVLARKLGITYTESCFTLYPCIYLFQTATHNEGYPKNGNGNLVLDPEADLALVTRINIHANLTNAHNQSIASWDSMSNWV
jgi:hypothetical protein